MKPFTVTRNINGVLVKLTILAPNAAAAGRAADEAAAARRNAA